MIKRIYTIFISSAFAVLTFTSCSDWLNVYPSDEIKEEYLFSTGNGYRTALNGIYRKLSTSDLYGCNLTWGIVDAWAQCYYIEQAPTEGKGKGLGKIAVYDFKHSDLVPTTDAMWNAAWNVVANCNELAQQAAAADSMLFFDRERERQMIYAEAVGLRAFMQFDLLRIYAPAPASNNPNDTSSEGVKEDNRTFIPYVNVYPSYVNDHQTVAYCLDKIIEDLKEAQRILLEVDKESKFHKDSRFISGTAGENVFLSFRGYRLNYYAVTAELARVYLYAKRNTEAYNEAMKIINYNKENGYFKASTSAYDITNGNLKMCNDIIFGLYSPTELVDWDHEINHATDNANTEYYLCIDSEIAQEIYGNEITKDFRSVYQLESRYYGYYYRTLKYYKQSEGSKYGKLSNQTIPLIRMSEVYYIAAEVIFATNPEEAKGYLQLVKKGRGVTVNLSKDVDKEEFMELLVNEYRREYFGEGQLMYMYKRMNRPIQSSDPYDREEVMPEDKYAVLPLPDSESNIK